MNVNRCDFTIQGRDGTAAKRSKRVNEEEPGRRGEPETEEARTPDATWRPLACALRHIAKYMPGRSQSHSHSRSSFHPVS